MAKSFLVAGIPTTSTDTFEVADPYNAEVVAEVCSPSDTDVENALGAAHGCFDESRKLPIHVRAEGLMHISRRLKERADEIAELIAREGGKPIKWARVEADRAVATFRWAAEEIRREPGELMRLDTDESLGPRAAIIRRFPRGPVLAIAPFNFPVNLVAHKMAPALAVGAPVVIKPATKTPLGALVLGEIFLETEFPKEMLSVLPISGGRAGELARDERFKKISFTGSSQVGWELAKADPKKKVTLELGGNAGVIVHSDADLEHAAERIAFGGYYQAGQSCVSVQRVFVHSDVAGAFKEHLRAAVEGLTTGNPMDEATDVGPLIDKEALDKVSLWVDEAVQAGAEIVTGGKREDPFYLPTILTNTTSGMKVRRDEIFGPVTTLDTYSDFSEAIDRVNETNYGLQAGVFTNDMQRIFYAHREIQAGGVVVNDVSAFRADQMPYGGTKDSGTGREGLRWAMEEMTEPKVLVLSNVDL